MLPSALEKINIVFMMRRCRICYPFSRLSRATHPNQRAIGKVDEVKVLDCKGHTGGQQKRIATQQCIFVDPLRFAAYFAAGDFAVSSGGLCQRNDSVLA